MSAMSADFS